MLNVKLCVWLNTLLYFLIVQVVFISTNLCACARVAMQVSNHGQGTCGPFGRPLLFEEYFFSIFDFSFFLHNYELGVEVFSNNIHFYAHKKKRVQYQNKTFSLGWSLT